MVSHGRADSVKRPFGSLPQMLPDSRCRHKRGRRCMPGPAPPARPSIRAVRRRGSGPHEVIIRITLTTIGAGAMRFPHELRASPFNLPSAIGASTGVEIRFPLITHDAEVEIAGRRKSGFGRPRRDPPGRLVPGLRRACAVDRPSRLRQEWGTCVIGFRSGTHRAAGIVWPPAPGGKPECRMDDPHRGPGEERDRRPGPSAGPPQSSPCTAPAIPVRSRARARRGPPPGSRVPPAGRSQTRFSTAGRTSGCPRSPGGPCAQRRTRYRRGAP